MKTFSRGMVPPMGSLESRVGIGKGAQESGALPSYLRAYYCVKPLIPRHVQVKLRSYVARRLRRKYAASWPLNPGRTARPDEWTGWPEKKRFAVVLTHDVESARGLERVEKLVRIEQEHGFRSSFNFVPERSKPTPRLRKTLSAQGFEVGVHGLYHDGRLLESYHVFSERAKEINHYLEAWQAVGFRAPSMHGNLRWFHELNIKYDLSTFDNDPFEPMSIGAGTFFPFWVPETNGAQGYVELPYTLTQDFTVFVLLKEKDIDIWKHQIDAVAAQGGMVLVNTHPDYMTFRGADSAVDEYPVERYEELLDHLRTRYAGEYWPALPKELEIFCRK